MPRPSGKRVWPDRAGRVPGWDWILQAWWTAVRRQVTGRDHGDIPTLLLRDTLEQTITAIRRRWSVHAGFAEALRQYAHAEMDGDTGWSAVLRSWFEGENVHAQGGEVRARLRRAGISESVNRVTPVKCFAACPRSYSIAATAGFSF